MEKYKVDYSEFSYFKGITIDFDSLEEGKAFVAQIPGYTLENEDDFVQGNKVEITNI